MFLYEEIEQHLQDANLDFTTRHLLSRAIGALKMVPNPHAAFSCNGVNVQGDAASIKAVQAWHHSATEVEPALRSRIATMAAIPPRLKVRDQVEIPDLNPGIRFVSDPAPSIKGRIAKIEVTVWCDDMVARVVGSEDVR